MEAKDIIKSRLPIQDVISGYIKIERAGSSFKACCPFHKEKSPSFNISPARDAFYCFGCQKGGDIFTFIQEMEGVNFSEALKMLADKAGVQLPERSQRLPQEQDARERLFAIMEAATQYYEAMLKSAPDAVAYLYKRGLTDETIAKFRIGFVPDGWRNLRDHLIAKKFTDLEMENARLVKPTQGKAPYDTFRSRIMFPIMDTGGRVIAFTGRVWGAETTSDGSAIAKYLNSPEGELYSKSHVLFGYDRAKQPMRQKDRLILVEGQMDCIMSHQAGAENTVAISGTALTEDQLKLIKRLTENVTLALDADNAGINATLRSARLAIAAGMKVTAVRVPDGKDPADYILGHKESPLAWSEVLALSEPIVPYLLHVYASLGLRGDALRERIAKEVLPLVASVQSRIEQAQYAAKVARVLDVPELAVLLDVDKLAKNLSIESANMPLPKTMLANKELVPVKSNVDKMLEELVAITLFAGATSGIEFPSESINREMAELAQRYKLTLPVIDKENEAPMLMKVEATYSKLSELPHIAHELIDRIEREAIKVWQVRITDAMKMAEREKKELTPYLEKQRALVQRLRSLEDKPTIS